MSWTKAQRPPKAKRLSAGHERALVRICEKWRQIALCTRPADKNQAEASVAALYQSINQEVPKEILWTGSVKKALKEAPFEPPYRNRGDEEISWWRYDLALSDPHSVQSIWHWGMLHYFAPVMHSIDRTISNTVPSWWNLQRSVHRAMAPDWRSNQVRVGGFGQFDLRLFALGDFLLNEAGCPLTRSVKSLPIMLQIASSCYSVWFGKSKVVLIDRPLEINVDERGRAHCEDGPAILFRNKLAAYAIHGVPMPKKYVNTPAENIDLAELTKEPNVEVRTAVLSKVGIGRFLQSQKFKVVSQANNNRLIEFPFGNMRLRVLHLRWNDKEGAKETILPVPRTLREFGPDRPERINDCEQVRRWTLGWPMEAIAVAET